MSTGSAQAKPTRFAKKKKPKGYIVQTCTCPINEQVAGSIGIAALPIPRALQGS